VGSEGESMPVVILPFVDSRVALPGFVVERKEKAVHGICG